MTEEERDLVHTLPGEQRSGGHGVSERMHRGKRPARNRYSLTVLVELVEDRERRRSIQSGSAALCLAQRPGHVALLDRMARACCENKARVVAVPRRQPVPRENDGQLPRNGNGPRRTVGLGGPAIAVSVHLPPELDLCVIGIVDADISPGQGAELGNARTRQGSDGEQRPERLVGGSDRLLELFGHEDWPALRMRDLRPLRPQPQRRGNRPAQPSLRVENL